MVKSNICSSRCLSLQKVINVSYSVLKPRVAELGRCGQSPPSGQVTALPKAATFHCWCINSNQNLHTTTSINSVVTCVGECTTGWCIYADYVTLKDFEAKPLHKQKAAATLPSSYFTAQLRCGGLEQDAARTRNANAVTGQQLLENPGRYKRLASRKATLQLYLHTALRWTLRARWELGRGASLKETSSGSLLLLLCSKLQHYYFPPSSNDPLPAIFAPG